MINLKTGKKFNSPSAREQMTRREFGKGLAAIIGAGVAPSIALGTVSLAGSANATVGGSARGMMRGVGGRLAAISGEKKPYDYELQWFSSNTIAATGYANAYINTRMLAGNSVGFRVRSYRIKDTTSDVVAFGCRNFQGDQTRWFCGGYHGVLYAGWNTLYTKQNLTLGLHEWRVNYLNDRKIYIDGGDPIAENLPQANVRNKHIAIVCYNTGAEFYPYIYDYYLTAEIEITVGTDVYCHYIPVSVGGRCGLFNKVDGNVHYSDTQYDFIGGPRKD